MQMGNDPLRVHVGADASRDAFDAAGIRRNGIAMDGTPGPR
jgi:hypothetical protein